MKMLDCFCGLGGVSDGFAFEGFDVLGIDIEDMPAKGYKHKFLKADIRDLKGENFRGYDVIWGSPPCRDFTQLGCVLGHRWKRPQDPEYGMQFVNSFLKFVKEAKPKYWIMENSPRLERYLKKKPRIQKGHIGITMKRSFWGNFPLFLLPLDSAKKKLTNHARTYNPKIDKQKSKISHLRINGKIPKHESWVRAKIPLACSRAFSKACKEALECHEER